MSGGQTPWRMLRAKSIKYTESVEAFQVKRLKSHVVKVEYFSDLLCSQ